MNPERIEALADMLDAMKREQSDFPLFTIGSDDKISMADAETIITALRSYAKARRWGQALNP